MIVPQTTRSKKPQGRSLVPAGKKAAPAGRRGAGRLGAAADKPARSRKSADGPSRSKPARADGPGRSKPGRAEAPGRSKPARAGAPSAAKPARAKPARSGASGPSGFTPRPLAARPGPAAKTKSGAKALRPAYGSVQPVKEKDKALAAAPERQEVRHVGIDSNSDGQRLDNFLLKHLPGVPKSHVYRLLRSGQVRVDGGRVKADRRLSAGEQVRIPPVRMADPREPVRPPDRVLNELRECVVHEDDHYLVINKPHGISAHAGTGQLYGVIEAIRAWEKYEFIELCHRLDRDTSGVLLLAKSRQALLRAQRAFMEGTSIKRYFALLIGKWRGEDRDVDAALVKVRLGDQHHVQLDEDGKPSKSRFSPRAKYRESTLCEVEIFSGRTHQIRVHALALGHPVAGDDKYGERQYNAPLRERGLKRMFLHSHFLQLPATGDFPKLILNAPMPDELRNFLQRLQ